MKKFSIVAVGFWVLFLVACQETDRSSASAVVSGVAVAAIYFHVSEGTRGGGGGSQGSSSSEKELVLGGERYGVGEGLPRGREKIG